MERRQYVTEEYHKWKSRHIAMTGMKPTRSNYNTQRVLFGRQFDRLNPQGQRGGHKQKLKTLKANVKRKNVHSAQYDSQKKTLRQGQAAVRTAKSNRITATIKKESKRKNPPHDTSNFKTSIAKHMRGLKALKKIDHTKWRKVSAEVVVLLLDKVEELRRKQQQDAKHASKAQLHKIEKSAADYGQYLDDFEKTVNYGTNENI